MGLGLDSSVMIDAERKRVSVSELLEKLEAVHGETEFSISAVTAMELEHGFHRALSAELAIRRRRYIDEVFAVLPTHPFTRGMGLLAGEIDAGLKKAGIVVATADLLIGVTALYYGDGIGTANIRHFRMIPGLKVLPL